MDVKLKPCPFCGAVPTIRGIQHKWLECVLYGEDNKFTEESWWISCETEHCPAYHMLEYPSKEEATEAWNRRVDNDRR